MQLRTLIIVSMLLGITAIILLEWDFSSYRAKRVIEKRREDVHSLDPEKRRLAISQLAHSVDLGISERSFAIEALRNDPSEMARGHAVMALSTAISWDLISHGAPDWKTFTALLKTMTEDPNEDVRDLAAEEIGSFLEEISKQPIDTVSKARKIAKPYLNKAIHDNNRDVREYAQGYLELLD